VTDERLTEAVIYAVPLWGILHRSAAAPTTYLGSDLVVLPVPAAVDWLAGAVALGLVGLWSVGRFRAWRAGALPLPHTLYVFAHIVAFLCGYIVTANLDHGWLCLNVWHSTQYLMFVWLFHTGRQRRAPARGDRGRSAGWLFLATLVGATVLGFGALRLGSAALDWVVPATLVLFMATNFHHYIADALLWRRPRASLATVPAHG